MPAIDQNGLPEVGGAGTLTDAEIQTVINSPAQPEVTFGSMVRGFLDIAAGVCWAVIDPVTRLFKAGEGAAGAAIVGASEGTAAYAATKFIRIHPDPAQTGRSLTWEPSDEGLPTQALMDAVLAITGATKPKISVESLVSRVLGAIPDALQDKVLVVVDQDNAAVNVVEFNSAANRALAVADVAAVNIAAAHAVAVTLSEPAAAGGADPLVFEGGSTGV
jgi:hypothetical protein